MVNIFAGLEKFGLDLNSDENIFENETPEKRAKANAKVETIEETEDMFLLDRTYVCPICDSEVKAKTVKNGKARLISTDLDLRAKHHAVDMVKYDVIVCHKCGYSALSRYFNGVISAQRKLILEKITPNYVSIQHNGAVYTYDEAIERYQLALANAVVKKAKASEKAYICLKMGWLVRGYRESLDTTSADYIEKNTELEGLEREYLKNAMEGFIVARQKEMFPMCGMDENTMDYLIAALAVNVRMYNVAAKMVSTMLAGVHTPKRIKDKARDLKDIIIERRGEE